MSPVFDWRQQACLGQLGEMRAGGLRCDARRVGQLTGSKSAAIEKRREHRGSRRLPDQRRYLGDERACNHVSNITPSSVSLGENTSMPIEANPVRLADQVDLHPSGLGGVSRERSTVSVSISKRTRDWS